MSRAPHLQTVLAAELARIEAEIERIQADIARLEAERETLLRVERRLNGAAEPPHQAQPLRRGRPPSRDEPGALPANRNERGTLHGAVQEVVAAADGDGLKVADVVARVQAVTPWQRTSIRTALYHLAAQGLLKREGHLWKPAGTV